MAEEKSGGGLGDLVGKAKDLLTDERIDDVAAQIKKVAPDSLDKQVDNVAEQAKKLND